MNVKKTLYEQLQNINDKLPNHDVRIIVGDLNAKVRKDNNKWQKMMGPHVIGSRNNNGQRLLEFGAEQILVIGGTVFHHKNIHKTTWSSPDGLTQTR